MNRRRFLSTALTGMVVTIAGCHGVSGSTELRPARVERETGGRRVERQLFFDHEDTPVGAIVIDQQTPQTAPTDPFKLRLHVEHGAGRQTGRRPPTTIEAFRFDLRAPARSVDPPAEVYLESPAGGLWPDITFREVENRWTRIALSDVGELGDGTLTLETLIDPVSLPATPLGCRADVDLRETTVGGQRYRLTARTRFEPIVEG